MSPEREREMEETGDPSTLAPELCVEILSETNTEAEMKEKRRLYRDVGAEKVWIVNEEGQIRFVGETEMGSSRVAPGCPTEVDIQ